MAPSLSSLRLVAGERGLRAEISNIGLSNFDGQPIPTTGFDYVLIGPLGVNVAWARALVAGTEHPAILKSIGQRIVEKFSIIGYSGETEHFLLAKRVR